MLIQQQYSLDPHDDECLQGAHVAAVRADKPIRLRVQPQLFTWTPNRHRAGMYLGWKGVYWNLACPTVDDVLAVRDALASFFRLLETYPTAEVTLALDNWRQARIDSALPLSPTIRHGDPVAHT